MEKTYGRPSCECCGETMWDDFCRICEPDIELRQHPQSQSGAHLPYCAKHNRWLTTPALSDMVIRDASSYYKTTGEMPVITAETDTTIEAMLTHWNNCATCQKGEWCSEYDQMALSHMRGDRTDA